MSLRTSPRGPRVSRRPANNSFIARMLLLAALPALATCVDGLPTEVGNNGADVPLNFSLQTASNLSSDEQDALARAFDIVDRFHIQLTEDGQLKPFLDTLVMVQPGQDEYILNLTVPAEAVEDEAPVTLDLTGAAGETELFASEAEITVVENAAGEEGAVALPIRYTGPGLHGVVEDPDGLPAAGLTIELFQESTVVQTAVTDINGEYLFTELQAGTYVIRVQTQPDISSCPSERTVGPLGEDDKVVSGFKLSRTGCTLKILVMSGGDIDDTGGVIGAVGSLIPEGTFSSAFVVVSPPALADLLPFDVVLLFENGTYEHATDVGSRVAEYVNAGGNLVIGSFYWQNRSDSGYGRSGWGALESLDPFSSAGGANYGPGSLGSLTDHPITSGITSVSVPRWWGGVSGGGTVVATWADGSPMAGFVVHQGGQRVVGISAFPGLAGSSPGLAALYANALRWAGGAGGPSQVSRFGGSGR